MTKTYIKLPLIMLVMILILMELNYSIVKCKRFDVSLTPQELIFEKLNIEDKKYFFCILSESSRYTRYSVIKKTWKLLDKDNKKKDFSTILFDYFEAEGFIVFHSEIHKATPVIRYLNYTHDSEILIPRYIDLKEFLEKLKPSKIIYSLLEGRVVNYELKFGTIGNFHFKNIVKKDLNEIIKQKNSYFSTLKYNVEGVEKNYDIELYSNGSFYLPKGGNTLFDILKIYLSLIENKIKS